MRSSFNYRLKRLTRGTLASLALLSPRFDPILKTNTPLMRMEYPGEEESGTLIVFLPGIGDLAEDFERRGFIAEMRRHGITADAVAIDAHYGYYASRAIHERITQDVIASAREAGYEQIWLAGVSLGGFGAASYAARNASDLAGLLLFAPYLGGAGLVREIAAAGGVRSWQPGAVDENDFQRALWTWFKRDLNESGTGLPIYLGYGERDMFESANALLAELLPEKQVHAIPGGHDWQTWKKLWQLHLPNWKGNLR
jgi:pimeloyl-ACP methyl ester carboxylesterase